MDDIQDKLSRFIGKELASGKQIAPDTNLEKVIDSTAIMEVVAFVEGEFRVSVEVESLSPDNFGSVEKIAKYVQLRQRG